MRITFLGGADEVGASSILIEIAGRRLLVDAGIRPSPKARWGLGGDQLPHLSLLDPFEHLDAILVTHAHTDHTGGLELVVGRYPGVPVYATPPTIALTRVLHVDARRIMSSRLEEEGELPLFDDVAVRQLMDAFVPVPFHTRLPLAPDLAVTFFPAGHIAGAAMIGLDSGEGRVLISGDISVSPQRTVDGVKPPAFRPDVFIVESTYGGRLHANRAVQERKLVERIVEVTSNGGKVLIPAFALGRAQELIQILAAFRQAGELPPVPVWVDGMVRAICNAYTQFPEVLPLPMQERGARFFDEQCKPIERPDQREALIWENNPSIIISSSGMLAGGPSQSYARALAGQPQHAIFLTGYQDEESPGRRLQEMAERGRGSLKLGKSIVDVQCHLGAYSLSAHADEAQIVSLVETLDPTNVFLVHGDEAARASLEHALKARGRRPIQPQAGQSFDFSFRPSLTARGPRAIGKNKPLDLHVLWNEVAGPGGNYFTLRELSQAWWGDERHLDELRDALEKDHTLFLLDERRAELVRAQTREQVELTRARVEQMTALGNLTNQLVILRQADGTFSPAQVTRTERDRFWVEGEIEAKWPEEVVEVIGSYPLHATMDSISALATVLAPTARLPYGVPRSLDALLIALPSDVPHTVHTRAALALALLWGGAMRTEEGYLLGQPAASAPVEPNQALSTARSLFPAEARLRKTGYRLDEHVLVLNFDFPDTVRARFPDLFERLESETRWTIEIEPEANQSALAALARQVLPTGWEIIKGPSIYREDKRVALTVRSPLDTVADATEISDRFQATTGYGLSIVISSPSPTTATSLPITNSHLPSSAPMEINAAYAVIRRRLSGLTLYRVGLRGNEIVLAFISPQLGERYREEIAEISRLVGWPLVISSQPNQNAILEAARALVTQAGWSLISGPGIYTDRGQVQISVASPVAEEEQAAVARQFEAQTGYQLVVEVAGLDAPASNAGLGSKRATGHPGGTPVEIPVARIRITLHQQSLVLNPEKERKAVEQMRRGGAKPIRVRRTQDSYVLLDGLYRLKAAQALGVEKILAIVE